MSAVVSDDKYNMIPRGAWFIRVNGDVLMEGARPRIFPAERHAKNSAASLNESPVNINLNLKFSHHRKPLVD